MTPIVLTGRGRRWIEGGHPWVFANDIADGTGETGELVAVQDPARRTLGWGLYSAASKIAVRLVTRAAEQPSTDFWGGRVRAALAQRARHGLLQAAGAERLISGDADGIPGLVVDRYADLLVLQCGTPAADRLRLAIVEALSRELPFPIVAVLDRSDSSARRLESLEKRVEWLRGGDRGPLLVEERFQAGAPALRYRVDPLGGHKTGHYLDQRANRARAAELHRAAGGGRFLDAFSYDGLFGVRAALAGATEVLCLDQSAPAGERVLENALLNGVEDRVRFERVDCMQDLRERTQRGERWDSVVVDPPAFAKSKAELEGAARGYRELNRRALGLLGPGGLLVSASCSYNVRPEAFLSFLGQAAHEARARVALEDLCGAAVDHPVLLGLPESHYLKCAFLRVLGGQA